ncbi:MAG: AAA family ATPase [Polyangiaceae bacterium]
MTAPLHVPEEELPLELETAEAVVAAYPAEIGEVTRSLSRGLPVLVECEKELVPYFFRAVRDVLRKEGRRAIYLDGRPRPDVPDEATASITRLLLEHLREAVRGAVEERVVVLPHLDLITTNSAGGLTAEAREVIALMYENPLVLFLGFRDPSFPVPEVVTNLFARRVVVLGVPRDRLSRVITRRESRKLGRGLYPYRIYKHVSGVHAVKLRRLFATLDGEDYPHDPKHALAQLRTATADGDVELPEIDLDRDIGGYDRVKTRIKREILDILATKDGALSPERIKQIEKLVPRGMIFWGPPGTGKTLFAKAMASALGAAVIIVSGPELKSKWVGESEENLRRVFHRARKAAPSLIIFDEIDAFAARRGTFEGSGVEHSMVNQLLTEMDGFRSNELVFIVGTTNLPEALDPALLRPGRFEFQLHIPYPNATDREAILKVHDRALELEMNDDALAHAVRRTDGPVEGGATHYSGDHLQALCRAIARSRIREARVGATTPQDVERALVEHADRPELTAAEEHVVATHESGHAVVALHCEHAPPIERITIRGDIGGSLGSVSFGDPAHRHVITEASLRDRLATLYGGREAESLVLGGLSAGAEADLAAATALARSMVTELGMASDSVGAMRHAASNYRSSLVVDPSTSEATRERVDEAVRTLLEAERSRAARILREHRDMVVALTEQLVRDKVIETIPQRRPKKPD